MIFVRIYFLHSMRMKNQMEIVLWIKFSCRQNQFSMNCVLFFISPWTCALQLHFTIYILFRSLFKCLNIRCSCFFFTSRQWFGCKLKKNVCPQFMTETLVCNDNTMAFHRSFLDGTISVDVCVCVWVYFSFLCNVCVIL